MKTFKLIALLVLLAVLLFAGRPGLSQATVSTDVCREIGSVPTDLAMRRFASQASDQGTAACLRLAAATLEEGPACVIEHLWYGLGSQGEAVIKLLYWPTCEPQPRPGGDEPGWPPASPPTVGRIPVEPDVRNFACQHEELYLCLRAAADYLDEWDNRICGLEHVWIQPDSFDGNVTVAKLAFWPCQP